MFGGEEGLRADDRNESLVLLFVSRGGRGVNSIASELGAINLPHGMVSGSTGVKGEGQYRLEDSSSSRPSWVSSWA